MKIKLLNSFLIMTLFFLSSTIYANPEIQNDTENGQARYIIDQETGQLMMKIRLWGEVKNPGVILVPSESDLIEIISHAGGPTSMSRLSKVQVIRNTPQNGEEKILTVNIEEFLETGDASIIPKIYPEDTIIVKSSLWRMVSSSTVIISIALQLTTTFYNLSLIFTK